MSTSLFDRAHEQMRQLLDLGTVARIWGSDPAAWISPESGDEAAAVASIATRLGWLTTPSAMEAHLDDLAALAATAAAEGIEAIYLLGMGGSSLCAEVLQSVAAPSPSGAGRPVLHVLDTTDARTIHQAAGRLTAARSWFLVSSKSGSTIEVSSLERFFFELMTRSGVASPGSHFIAITDPGTALERLAGARGYRKVFLNPPDIGGRFSALSLFGLVPAALLGVDPAELLSAAQAMAEGCRQENHRNPGLELGAIMAVAAREGRDKLTLLLPPSLADLGLWIEQLVAESTGKLGFGILPVVGETIGRADEYGGDRLFVAFATDEDEIDPSAIAELERAGHPVVRLSTRRSGLGAEFFRWEFAVAVAGAVFGINPFDEPNVREAKEKTGQLIDRYLQGGRLPDQADAHATAPSVIGAGRLASTTGADALATAIDSLQRGDYFALLSYLSPDTTLASALLDIRLHIRRRARVATTVGVGPRYLHSTGQYHKGGPDTGVFVVLTSEDEETVDVPDAGYSFGVLKRAQALGDVEALAAHGRRVVRVHLPADVDRPAVLRRLFSDADVPKAQL